MPAPARFFRRNNVNADARTSRALRQDEEDRVAVNAPTLTRRENRRDRLRETRAFPLRARSAARTRFRRRRGNEQNVAPVHRLLHLLRRAVARAAASSIASGNPSSVRQISVIACAFADVRLNPGRAALARSTKS